MGIEQARGLSVRCSEVEEWRQRSSVERARVEAEEQRRKEVDMAWRWHRMSRQGWRRAHIRT